MFICFLNFAKSCKTIVFGKITQTSFILVLFKVWSEAYLCNSTWVALLQPLAYLSLFLSSGINPILYAFISQKFRSAVKDILNCRLSIFSIITINF